MMRNSIGLNFGSRLLAGVSQWPVDKSVPEAMREASLKIFAFDALIQNPDRRFENPNLLARGDDIFIFDHELAFSFLLDVMPSAEPWTLGGQQYLTNHVFYSQLRKRTVDLDEFTNELRTLAATNLEDILAEVPAEWNNEVVAKIRHHLRIVGSHAAEFAEEIRRRLA
jgi:hypothetical protein